MRIEFDEGEAGEAQAAALLRVVTAIEAQGEVDTQIQMLNELLRGQCLEFERRKAGSATREDAHLEGPIWTRWFGPSRREQQLSRQRIEALERAERAERSSFESLAEMARVARERDDALKRVRELERTSDDPAR